jgi:hypothetical protein
MAGKRPPPKKRQKMRRARDATPHRQCSLTDTPSLATHLKCADSR